VQQFPRFALFWILAFAAMSFAQTATKPESKAPPDVLEFTNGDKLTGKLERATGGNVVFKSDMAGELTIPFSKVKSLTSGSEFVALKAVKDGRIKPEGSGVVAFAGSNVILKPNTGEEHTLATKDLSYLVDVPTYAKAVDHRAGFRQGWTGTATAGFTLVRSTQTSTTFTGALNFVRTIPEVTYLPNRNRTTINVTESYGTSSTPIIPQTNPPSPPDVVQTSIFHADSERDEYYSPRLFALADLSFDHNFAQGLQLQQVYGIGTGWTPIQNAKEQLDLRADIHYEKQQFLPTGVGVVGSNGEVQDNLDLVGSTFQENYRRNLPRKFVLTEWANILPAWNDREAYSANAYLAVTMPIFKRLSATLSGTDNYLNDPSPGYRSNSVQFVTGVTYTIK
jgi:hypothetical protein